MANDDAWSSGWQQGAGAAQKKKDDKANKSKLGSLKGVAPTGDLSDIPKLHSGGKVKKTGNYRLRKGEAVLTIGQQKEAGIKKDGKKKSGSRKRIVSKGK